MTDSSDHTHPGLADCEVNCVVLCPVCRVRAVIKEDSKSPGDTVCREPSHGRRRVVYVSRGSLIEVRLASGSSATTSPTSDNTADEYFLVQFEGLSVINVLCDFIMLVSQVSHCRSAASQIAHM